MCADSGMLYIMYFPGLRFFRHSEAVLICDSDPDEGQNGSGNRHQNIENRIREVFEGGYAERTQNENTACIPRDQG